MSVTATQDWRTTLQQRGFATQDLAPHIATRVDGIDLADPMDADLIAALRAACAERVVLLFRGQTALPAADFLSFAKRFGGRPDLHSQRHYCLDAHHEIFVVGNAEENGRRVGASRVGLNWHTDHYHLPEPGLFTFLHAITVPPTAGETRYANGVAAYHALPRATRDRIDGLDVRHSRAILFKNLFPEASEEALAAERAQMPDVIHPLVRHHPEIAQDGLYLGGEWGSEIIADDGARLYSDLLDHLTQPDFVYMHHWQPGDVLMSDNRCSMHRATEWDESAYQRRLHRIILIDDAAPVAGRRPHA
jgi:taurine dioxygenase